MANFIEPIPATRKRPRAGLITVASRLPAGSDWRQGIEYMPEGCTAPDVSPICGDAEKAAPEIPPIVSFQPFLLVSTDGCNDAWASNEDLHQRALRNLDMGASALIARELILSSVGNPDLANAAVDVSGGVAVDWVSGLAALEYNMHNAGYVGDVWIFSPPWLQPAFNASYVGETEQSTGRSFSCNNPVVFDAGFSGLVPPDGVGVPVAVPGASGWVYAAGPVEWDTGEVLDDVAASGDNLLNNRFAVGERPAILRFDPCHVFAALIEANCI